MDATIKLKTRSAVLITGAARRVGRALAIFFAAKHGYDIVAHYNSSHQDALSLQEIVQNSLGRKCFLLQADLRHFVSLEKLIKQAFTAAPHLDTLVNNASVFHEDSLEQCSQKTFDENHSIHVRAPVFLTQYFTQLCSNAKIINVVDAGVTRTNTKYFSYLLSKKSLVDFTVLAASELASKKICINAICPTLIPEHELENVRSLENLDDMPQLKNFLGLVATTIDPAMPISGKVLFMDK